MKKFFLGVFVLFNLALIGGASFVLYSYLAHHTVHPMIGFPAAPSSRIAAPAVASAKSATGAVSVSTMTASPSMSQTKIFSYRNSHAKHVEIRADFTGWKAEPMQRDAAGVWTYKVALSPGEYAYCFSVDDKPPLKDPVNKRTKVIGRATVSAIVVGPVPLKPPK